MTETIETLLPGETLGLLGGGQLGRMFAQAAAQMGYHVLVLEPSNPSPAGEVSCAQIAAAYDDTTALDEMSRAVRAVTTEFENVPATSLEHLARLGVRTAPHADAVAVTQDRNREKAFAESAGVPTAPHAGICAESDWENVTEDLFPGILKTARLGYDGKGQVRVDSKADARKAWEALDRADCILEKRLKLYIFSLSSVALERSHDIREPHLLAIRGQGRAHCHIVKRVLRTDSGCAERLIEFPSQRRDEGQRSAEVDDIALYLASLCQSGYGLIDDCNED